MATITDPPAGGRPPEGPRRQAGQNATTNDGSSSSSGVRTAARATAADRSGSGEADASAAPSLRTGPSLIGWIAAVGTFLAACLALPPLTSTMLPPKAPVLLVLGAFGVPFLVMRAIGRGAGATVLAARAAVVFVVIAGLATLAAQTPILAFAGTYVDMTGWAFIVCLAGCWALGTMLNGRDRNALSWAVILAGLVNTAVSILQLSVNVSGLPTYGGQPTGMLGNPIFLGSVLVGSLVLALSRFDRRPLAWSTPVGFIALGIGLCGERLPAFLALVAVTLYVIQRVRRGRGRAADVTTEDSAEPHDATSLLSRGIAACRRVGADAVALVVAAIAVGSLMASSLGANGAINATASSGQTETFGQRFEAWSAGLHAFVHRPFLGYGPDQFRSATLERYSHAFVVHNGEVFFYDAHNIVIEYLVTTGILGTLALLAWLVLAVRGRRSVFLVVGILMLATELVEPVMVSVAAIAMLAIGAAPLAEARRTEVARDALDRPRWVMPVALCLATVAAATGLIVVIGDIYYQQSRSVLPGGPTMAQLSEARTATSLLRPWPDPAETVSAEEALRALRSAAPPHLRVPVAVHWAQVAVDRDPTDPINLTWLASLLAVDHQYHAAQADVMQAYRSDPNYREDLNLLGAFDDRAGNTGSADYLFNQSLQIDAGQGLISAYLDGTCAPALPGSDPNSPLSVGCIADR